MFARLDAAFKLFLRRLPTAAMIVLTIWLPANLLHNYSSSMSGARRRFGRRSSTAAW